MREDRPPPLELEEIRELEFEFLEELMAEPPHGHNHGRARTQEGGWRALETDPADMPSIKRLPVPTPHASAYAYRKLKCRCPICRAWKREQDRGRKR